MAKHAYGHRPPDIDARDMGSGWVLGIRHLASRSAKGSFWHRHDETSIVCCLRGEYVYELHGLPAITLSAGSFLVIPAQVEHRHLKAVDPVGDRLEILLSTNLRRTLRCSAFSADSCKALHASLLRRALSPVKCDNGLLRTWRELYALTDRSSGRLDEEELGLARLLCQLALYKMSRPSAPAGRRAARPVSDVAEWLGRHMAEKIDIDRLIAHIGYSRTQVFTFFRENSGLTPADFLTRLRIKKAQSLLESTVAPVGEIGLRCGFATASAFNNAFRRLTGTTPMAWRTARISQ